MKKQKICIIGDGLAGLTTALTLSNLDLDIDVYYKKNKNIVNDNRITAISESNFKFLYRKNILKRKKSFWSCKKISLYYEYKNNLKNFLNFENQGKDLMHIFKNDTMKNEMVKKIKCEKKIKLQNKIIKNISQKENYVEFGKNKKAYYDLIILCLGGNSKLYSKILNDRNITKNYNQIALTALVNHNFKIKNPSQYFLKEGPLAILPYSKNKFSLVWSLDNKFFKKNKKIVNSSTKLKIKNIFGSAKKFTITDLQFFPIHLNLKTEYFKNNILVFGQGIHSIHPIAGQGFNLIIRDIIMLYDLIAKNLSLGLTIKNSNILKDLKSSRGPENVLMGVGIDLTNSFFKQNKYFEPMKYMLLKKISKIDFLKKISKKISDTGIYF